MPASTNPLNPVLPSTPGPAATATPLLTLSDWGLLGGFAAALIGISIINPRIAGMVGVGAVIVILLHNSNALSTQLGLGG